jgi:hypothetical protein
LALRKSFSVNNLIFQTVEEGFDMFMEGIHRLDKGPYYLEEVEWLDVKTGPDNKKIKRRRTVCVPYTESEAKANLLRYGFLDYLYECNQ